MKNQFIVVVFLAGIITSTAAFAEVQKCDFTTWGGAKDEIAISWVGLGFRFNKSQGTAKVLFPNGKSSQVYVGELKIIRLSKLTTYKKKINQNTFSYRIYKSGKCTGRVEELGYYPITAKGRIN